MGADVVHLVADPLGPTRCCGRALADVPRGETVTTKPELATCQGQATPGIGSLVEALGVRLNLADDVMPTDAVLIVKVVQPDGNVSQLVGWSVGMSWIERRGMIEVARDVERCNERGGDSL